MKRKVVSLILVLGLALSLLPTAALAAEGPNTTFRYMEAKFGKSQAAEWKWLLETYGPRHANVYRWYAETDDDPSEATYFWFNCGSSSAIVHYQGGGYTYTREELYAQFLERLQTEDEAMYLYLTTGDAAAGEKFQPGPLWEENITHLNSKYIPRSEFHEGLAQVWDRKERQTKYGFVNADGRLVVPIEYDNAYDFSDGLALVEKDNKYGYIDASGKVVIPLEYDYQSGSFQNGVAVVCKDRKCGLLNRSGQVIVPLKYERINGFHEGLAAVEVSTGEVDENGWHVSKWGYIDTTGKVVIPLEYDYAQEFSEGLAAVRKDGKCGFIDTAGRVVIPFQYEQVGSFSEGLASASTSYLSGYIDKTGRMVIPEEYLDVRPFENGLAKISITWMGDEGQDEAHGVIDKTGKRVIPADYWSVGVVGNCIFADGVLYDAQGKVIAAKGVYDSVDATWGGMLTLKKGDKYGLANAQGQVILPLEYDFATEKNGYILAKKGGKYALLDQGGKPITAFAFDKIDYISEGLAFAKDDTSWGIMTLPQTGAAPKTAAPATQTVNVDGKNVEFAMYALGGGSTNYIRVRDLAAILNGTAAQFEVGWNGNVTLTTGKAYTGATDKAPFNTAMPYADYTAPTYVNGKAVNLEAIQITHNSGGYTYYKLRDLGQALGFNVGWSADKGIYVETGKPYDPNN